MSIYGIGTDIVEIARIDKLWQKYKLRFAQRILTAYELQAFAMASNKPVEFLAKRFAAKEAIVKALGTGFRDQIIITQLGIETGEHGQPLASFYGITKTYIEQLGDLQFAISIADESDYVLAFCIISKDQK